jgi:two-component system, OmpR family, KDP operon response regulator KdpE
MAGAPLRWVRMAKVLIVEDDDRVRVPLVRSLTTRGHLVTEASRGLPALQSVVDSPPDVVVLDLGLPDIDGGDLLKMLRAVSGVPLIVGTARDDEQEIVRLLDAGADDYIVKPFSAEQVDARIRALLRRGASAEPKRVEVGDLIVDAAARTASLKGVPLELSRKEFDLLLYLARRCGSVVTKRELLAEVWDQPYGGVEKTVDTHLSWLRAKLGESASAPRFLHTVRGVGIKLLAPPD